MVIKMRAMKDSGYPQFGQIPANWDVIPVKNKYKIITGFTPDSKNELFYDDIDGEVWVNISDIGESKFISDSKKKLTRLGIGAGKGTLVPKGSLLYSFKLSVGQVAFAENDLYTNEAIASFLVADNVDLNYLYYMGAYAIIFNANDNIYGAKLLNQQLINNAKVLFPPLSEQQQIANYLDKKVAIINNIIEKTKESIEEYKQYKQSLITETVTKGLNPDVKMKDSGIEWIGEIPEHWEIKAQKYVMSKSKEICEKYDGENILSLTRGGVIIRDLENPSGKMPTTFDGYQFVYPGNLLLCLFDIDVTPRCVGLINDFGLTSPAYSQFIVNDGYHVNYYNLLLEMIDDIKAFLHLSKNLRSSLTETDFGAIKTIVPPVEEQIEIAVYVEAKKKEIGDFIQKKSDFISELESYKKSLIYEVVTGKKEIQ